MRHKPGECKLSDLDLKIVRKRRNGVVAMPPDIEYAWIKDMIRAGEVTISEHVIRELLGSRVTLPEITSVLISGRVIEVHTHPRRSSIHVALGFRGSKPLHVMFSGSEHSCLSVLVVYEPKPPQWLNPYTRSGEGGMQNRQRSCFFCSGTLEPIVVGNFDYRIEGKLYVLKDVPAGLCLQCGEKYISLDVSKKIETLIATQQPEEMETVGVLRYRAD